MFIYKVASGYSSPESASGYYSTPENAAIAVTKQGGISKAKTDIFNKDGIVKLIKVMTCARNGIGVHNTRIYKYTLK